MSDNFTLRDLEIITRAIDGIYYGPKVHVLIRRGDDLLIWVPGHPTWNGTGQPWRYAPSSMLFHLPDTKDSYKRLATGGTLKRALANFSDRIDEQFGEGMSKLIEPGRTVIL